MTKIPEPISHTVDAIYVAIASRARGGDSLGVPMSNVAAECERAIWYGLRWAAPVEEITGQKARRFETGVQEEYRLLNDLRAAGFEVETIDWSTGKQFRVELANGWLRGKLDGMVSGLPEAPKTKHVVECKSDNDKSFKELLKYAPPRGNGLKQAKLAHYAQVQCYMHAIGLKRALYLAVNKNSEELYAERIEYDAAFCLALETKIKRIVSSNRAPSRLYDDLSSKAAFACKWCPALAICHEGLWARRNCRTCISADFRDGAIVHCTFHNRDLSYDEQQAGCDKHLYLPSLVPGRQINASERWISYQINGLEWVDGDE